jgi:hypothetical protein
MKKEHCLSECNQTPGPGSYFEGIEKLTSISGARPGGLMLGSGNQPRTIAPVFKTILKNPGPGTYSIPSSCERLTQYVLGRGKLNQLTFKKPPLSLLPGTSISGKWSTFSRKNHTTDSCGEVVPFEQRDPWVKFLNESSKSKFGTFSKSENSQKLQKLNVPGPGQYDCKDHCLSNLRRLTCGSAVFGLVNPVGEFE